MQLRDQAVCSPMRQDIVFEADPDEEAEWRAEFNDGERWQPRIHGASRSMHVVSR